MWIPQENEHSFGQKDNQQTPQSRPQETVSVNFYFTKASRLLSRADFIKTSRQGKRYSGKLFIIDYHFSTYAKKPKIGISISRKFGNAAVRNRVKRCLREAFRLNQHLFPKNLFINVIPKVNGSPISLSCCQRELECFLTSITQNNNCDKPTRSPRPT